MLQVSDLTVRTPDRVLLDSVTFAINRNERVGIVGSNGAGKSTLLAVIAGTRVPDAGSARVPEGATVGYLRQGVAERPHGRLRDLLDDHLHGLLRAERELGDATSALGEDAAEETVRAFERASHAFDALGGYERMGALEESMHAFGWVISSSIEPFHHSPGVKKRALLLRRCSPSTLISCFSTNPRITSIDLALKRFCSSDKVRP